MLSPVALTRFEESGQTVYRWADKDGETAFRVTKSDDGRPIEVEVWGPGWYPVEGTFTENLAEEILRLAQRVQDLERSCRGTEERQGVCQTNAHLCDGSGQWPIWFYGHYRCPACGLVAESKTHPMSNHVRQEPWRQ